MMILLQLHIRFRKDSLKTGQFYSNIFNIALPIFLLPEKVIVKYYKNHRSNYNYNLYIITIGRKVRRMKNKYPAKEYITMMSI